MTLVVGAFASFPEISVLLLNLVLQLIYRFYNLSCIFEYSNELGRVHFCGFQSRTGRIHTCSFPARSIFNEALGLFSLL